MAANARRVITALSTSEEIASSGHQSRSRPHKRVATHANPDADALVSTWMVERYLFSERMDVVFLPYDYDWTKGDGIDVIVDFGGLHDPYWLLFDHKQPARQDRNETCATRLVWGYLQSQGMELAHLLPLVDAVHDGDSVKRRSGSQAYQVSRQNGFHGWLGEAKQKETSDEDLYRQAKVYLNRRHGKGPRK